MRLIDAHELRKLFKEEFKRTKKMIADGQIHLDTLAEGYAEADHLLRFVALTVDAVPVVRCRDCVYAKSAKINKKGYRICPASHMEITDDDFCSYGEKKEDENGRT
mgnify:CR=1 FL=1